jgi:hypothetical protein
MILLLDRWYCLRRVVGSRHYASIGWSCNVKDSVSHSSECDLNSRFVGHVWWSSFKKIVHKSPDGVIMMLWGDVVWHLQHCAWKGGVVDLPTLFQQNVRRPSSIRDLCHKLAGLVNAFGGSLSYSIVSPEAEVAEQSWIGVSVRKQRNPVCSW